MELNEVERNIQVMIKNLSAQMKLDNKRIFLFGCNIYTERINNFLYEEGYSLSYIIDNDKEKQGKEICNIPICAPESIEWEKRDIVLIASGHYRSMKEQLYSLSENIEISVLFNFEQYRKNMEKKNKFWLEENFETEIQELYQGAAVYEKLKSEEPIVIIMSALGDIFACGLYLSAYRERMQADNIKIVIASKGVYKVARLFDIDNLIIISNQELNVLVKFLLFNMKGDENIVVCSCIRTLDTMARYKNISFPRCWAKYFFKLDNTYKISFPLIWDEILKDTELENKGMKKGRTVILAPYTNTLAELPYQFWELLVKRLVERKYYVFTNVVGDQKAIKGSKGIEIPLNQVGNYLEFAGYFVALRSGLCDVVGRSRCRKIIIFRDRQMDIHCAESEFFDLHTENISEDSIQYIYDDNDFLKNIDFLIELILDTKVEQNFEY